MEAMAMGKAVVATDVNGARELMEDGKTGLVIPPADSEALANAIDLLIDDPEKLSTFGTAGKKRVTQHFTMRHMTDILEAHLQSKLDPAKQ